MPAEFRLLSSAGHDQDLRITGVYFDLTDRFKPASAAERRQPDEQSPESPRGAVRPKVLISVAKRLVPSAVQRNTVKRIVRESWRTAVRNAVSMKAQGEQSLVCLVRLKRCPVSESTGPDAAARARPAARGRLGSPHARRSLRADIDKLFAVALSGAAQVPGVAGTAASRSSRRRTGPTARRPASRLEA